MLDVQTHHVVWTCQCRSNVVTEDLDRLFVKKGASPSGNVTAERTS